MNELFGEQLTEQEMFGSNFIKDPYSIYQNLLKLRIIKSELFGGAWLVAKYNQVNAILKDERFTNNTLHYMFKNFSQAEQRVLNDFYLSMQRWLPYLRFEQHAEMRRLMHKALQESSIYYYDELITYAEKCIIPYKSKGEMDFMSAVAYFYPAYVICCLLGVEEERVNNIIQWSLDYHEYISGSAFTFEGALKAKDAIFAIRNYFINAIQEKKIKEGTILEIFLNADLKYISQEELIDQFVILIVGGYVNNHNVLGNALLALIQHPDQLDILLCAQDKNNYLTAVRELIRFDPSSQLIPRMAMEDLLFEGVHFKKHDLILLFVGAANRDPNIFTNPNQLDLRRKQNPHLTFGAGVHTCVGLQLTYLTVEIVLKTLFSHVKDIQLSSEELNRIQSFAFRGVKNLPIKFTAIK